MYRIGIGYDIHRFEKGLPAGRQGRPLWLGGVQIPFEKGLDGHSDADALLHAITDAVLGAAGLPDIGHYFPPSDQKIKGIPSDQMLARAIHEIRRKGFKVVNVDSVLITEAPKISPYREAMRKRIAKLLSITPNDVQIKGKTNEGLGSIGKKQALAAQAVVLLSKSPSPCKGEGRG